MDKDKKPTFKDIFNPKTTPSDYGDHAPRVARWRRAVALLSGLAVATSSLFVGYELTKERVVGEHSVTVENGNQPGPEVCGAVAELAEKHGFTANTGACLDDLKGVTLKDGTKVDVAVVKQGVGVTGSDIVLNKQQATTSIDYKIKENRSQ